MRNMSFALTTEQVRRREKTVSRRLGPQAAKAKPGELRQPIVKGQGLKKGEHVDKIGGPIRFVDVRLEPLRRMIDDLEYGRREVVLEGFPDMTPQQFVTFFMAANECHVGEILTRIAFEYLEVSDV